jgi:Family of unknown function (DUF6350)
VTSSAEAPGHRLAGQPVPVLAAVAGVGSAVVVAIPLVLISILTWIAAAVHDAGGPFSGALRSGVLVWLAGNHVPVHLDGLAISLSPLGLLAVVGLCLFLAGRRLGRELDDERAAVLGGLYLAASYAVVLTVTALGAGGTGRWGANPLLAFVIGALVALVGGGAGVAAGSSGVRVLSQRLPQWVRSAIAGGLAGSAALTALAALVLAGSLVAGRTRVEALVSAYHGGAVELASLGLMSLALLPNAVGFVVAYLLGPGFVLGSGMLVSPQVVDLGEMPALPLLGALPGEGVPPLNLVAVAGAALLAAVIAVVVTARRDLADGVDWRLLSFDAAVLRPAVAGVVAALVLMAVMALSGGGLGSGRLSFLGPALLPAAALAVSSFGLVGAAAGALRWLVAWLGHRADV